MNYFSAGPLIQTTLKAQLAADGVTARVQAFAGWEQLLQSLQAAPLIGIWHQADKIPAGPGSQRNNGQRQIVDQVWAVVVAVRNVADPAGAGAQADADTIIASLLKLMGVRLDGDHGPLYRVQSQYMSGYRQGYGIYPFAFSTRIAT